MQAFREHRYPTRFPLTIQTDLGKTQVTVLNISEKGAKLQGVPNLRVGSRITIPGPKRTPSAIIRWIKDNSAGIAFQPGSNINVDEMVYTPKSQGNVTPLPVAKMQSAS